MIFGSSAAQKYHMRWFEKHLPNGRQRAYPPLRHDAGWALHRRARRRRRCCRSSLTSMFRRRRSNSWIFATWLWAARPAWSTASPIPAISAMKSGWRRLISGGLCRSEERRRRIRHRRFRHARPARMRLEKNFPTWFRELRPIYGGFEERMDRFIAGEERLHRPRGGGEGEADKADGNLRRVSMFVEAARRRCDGRRAYLGESFHGLRHRWQDA